MDRYKFDNFLKEVYLDSDTRVGLLSGAPFDNPENWFLSNDQIKQALREAGDTLRAFVNNPRDLSGGWTLENNARGPHGEGGGPQNTGQGPGGGRYYWQQNFITSHDDTSLGGVAQVPGFPDVLTTSFNPNRNNPNDIFSGGVRWFNNAVGNDDKNYELFTDNGATFGKAAGLGDLIAIPAPAR